MRDTADHILDAAQDLIQTRGFSAMSFQDVADRVGIKKPSIVHHFPSKNALGEAVVRRYRERFAAALAAVRDDPEQDAWATLEFYFTPYLEFAHSAEKVCLCGALAGEILALPAGMRGEVRRFFENHQRWLEEILETGQGEGVFALFDAPRPVARLFVAALQGALLVKRTTGDIGQLLEVVETIRSCVRAGAKVDR